MTGMTGNSVYELFSKTKSANWNRYFSGFSAIRSEEIKSPYIIWHTEKRESRGIFDYLLSIPLYFQNRLHMGYLIRMFSSNIIGFVRANCHIIKLRNR